MEKEQHSASPLDIPVRPLAPTAFAIFAVNGNIRIWSKLSEVLDKNAGDGVIVPLYSLQPEQLRLLLKADRDKAWKARDLTKCKCDHNETCDHCFPPEFRREDVKCT